ncbi:hypothetical protein BDV93DRAFT_527791 [Ceratobasidium sp. AG-I]|nr:hypothetical protein BDV93DRAFT_527791 [Ceratobasidium sp. AG-I]
MEGSDDEMDLLAPKLLAISPGSPPASRLTPARSKQDDIFDDDEEEVLTSDAEELAELAANRSLERYFNPASNSRRDKTTQQTDFEQGLDLGAEPTANPFARPPQTPVRTPGYRSRALSTSSSPARLTQTTDGEDTYIDTSDTPHPLLTSSPESSRRYSPPQHLAHRRAQSVEVLGQTRPQNMSGDEMSDEVPLPQSPIVEANLLAETDSDMDIYHTDLEVVVDSPNQPDPQTPPRQVSVAQPSSPLTPPSPQEAGSPPRRANPEAFPSLSSPAPAHRSSPRDPSPIPGPSVLDLDIAPQGRTLRTRTARQQHPYAIEYAHYKNSMRRAGLDDAIVKFQNWERQQNPSGDGEKRRPVMSEMQGFIVPEDEESQDLYVPPATPPPAPARRPAEPRQPSVDVDVLFAGFGGVISDDEAPDRSKRKDKGVERTAKKKRVGPKPFPLNNVKSMHKGGVYSNPSSPLRSEPGPSKSPTRRLPPSSPASSESSIPRPSGIGRRTSAGPRHVTRPNSSKQGSSDSGSNSKSGSDTDAASSDSLASLERERFRILNRMMPAAWVRRQLEEQKQKRRQARSSGPSRRDEPLRPGQAQARTTARRADQPLVLIGDSESEGDDGQPTQSHDRYGSPDALRPVTSPSPPTRTQIRPRAFPPKHAAHVSSDDGGNDIVDIVSSDDSVSILGSTQPERADDDDEISSWLVRRSPKRPGGGGGGGGGDLINRMLNRTREPAQNRKRGSRKSRAGYDQDGRKLKQAKLTSMFRASSPDGGVVEVSSSSDDNTRARPGTKPRRNETKESRRSGGNATRSSKPKRAFTIGGDLAELLDATITPHLVRRQDTKKSSMHNRAVSANNVLIREGQGRPPTTSNAPTTASQSKAAAFSQKSVSTDCGIAPFSPHTKFSPSTYIGRGYLQNLIDVALATNAPPVEATPFVVFGEHLDTRLTGTEFVDQIRQLIPHWVAWLAERGTETEPNVSRSFRFVALRITFLLESPPEEFDQASYESGSVSVAFLEEDAAEIYKLVNALSQDDPALKDASLASEPRWLAFHWFVVELAVRVACGIRRRALRISESSTLVSKNLDSAIHLLIRSLLGHDLAESVRRACDNDTDLDNLVLEIWVCLLYLIDDTEFNGATSWKPLWSRVESALDQPEFVLSYKVYESERRWELIFAFAALGLFSSQTGRLLSSPPPIARWAWVCKTIKDIRLKEDNVVSGTNPRRQRIDFYVRTVTARCWLLHTMWGWSYSQPDRLLTLLHPVFQSRKLAKLRDEKTDFPLFIRDLDLEHLERFSNGDTAWSIFLKIFRRAIVDDPNGARKLYAICTPIGVLNFTDDNPATDMDLSRLLNRFSIFLVILITDPTFERGTDCVRRIQALISFKSADMRSREACIRAFQYTGLLFKFYQLDLAPLVSWMHNILDSLREDLQKSTLLAQRNRLVVLMLCLVRSVAAVVCTCGFDRDNKRTHPEVGLLTKDFVQTLFQLDLKGNIAARREIRHLLEAVCHARDAFIATLPPKPPPPAVHADEESQESYSFDDFDLDLNDPAILAGLDALEGVSQLQTGDGDPFKKKETIAAELMNHTVSPLVFDHVIIGLGLDDRRISSTPERGDDAVEESAWIKVWFSCVKIVVENHQRTWWDYLNNWGNAKQERISRIIDIAAERRVRIHFCYLALKHTPTLAQRGSKEQKAQLLLPWFQCLPHHRYTVEHKYTALICDIGLASDPLLEGLPCRTNDKGEHYVLSSELMTERANYVRCILVNLARLSQANQEGPLSVDLTRARTCVAKLFETMKYTWEHLSRQHAPSADRELIPSYFDFCRDVHEFSAELLLPTSAKDLYSRLSWVPPPPVP